MARIRGKPLAGLAEGTYLAVILWAMFGVTLWLLFVQAFLLHAFCRYRLFSAALIFVLAAVVLIPPSD